MNRLNEKLILGCGMSAVRSIVLYVLVAFAAVACTQPAKHTEPGLCLSFDDEYVNEWYALRPLFSKYGAKVTFFVSNFQRLSLQEIDQLHQLEKDGHEVAFHGSTHALARTYILKYGYRQYLNTEIDSGLIHMRKAGFNPRSFAYPFGSGFIITDFFLKKRFAVIRRAVFADASTNLSDADEIYHTYIKDRTITALDIDNNQPVSDQQLSEGLATAGKEKKVFLLFAHQPVDSTDGRSYQISKDRLEKLFSRSKQLGLRYYRVSDLTDRH